jgi:TatD DNase family protein
VHPDDDDIAPDASAPEHEVERLAVDAHCHLFLIEEEAGGVVATAREAGVGLLVCVGIDVETSRRSLELAESFLGVFASAGVHPHTASGFDDRTGSQIEELLAEPLVVAVGETGLDYYRRLSPPEDQRRAFRTHIALSRESGKPLVVHVRDAWPDAMAILGEEGAERVVLHCFTGGEAEAAEAAARGYFVSFAGNLTYPGAEQIRRVASTAEGSRLLTETDSPFLPPQPLRGTTNRPTHVMAVVDALAQARGETRDRILRLTSQAARDAFHFPR